MDDFEQDTRAGRAYLGGTSRLISEAFRVTATIRSDPTTSNYCRAALARVLRSDRPVDHQLRDMLADLFEPVEPLKTPWGSRKLTADFETR